MYETKSSRISAKTIIIRKVETGKITRTATQEKTKGCHRPYDKNGVNKLIYLETESANIDNIKGNRFN